MKNQEIPVNDRIRASTVRLVSDEGEQLGIKSIEDARAIADDAGLDLVLVAPNADPPVCRVMDYGKHKYRQKKRQAEQHHHQPQLKELRLRPKIEDHDLMVREKKAREFIGRGDRVLINVMFRGREMAHTELGRALLERVAGDLEDIAKIESPPRMEGRRMTMMIVRK